LVNKIAKGKRAERELAKILSDNGYLVWRPTWSRFQSKDIFNIADIIAIRKKGSTGIFTYIPNPIVFIQVKTNKTDFYKAKRTMAEFIDKCDNPYEIHVVIALRIKKNVWRFREFVCGKLEDYIEEFE